MRAKAIALLPAVTAVQDLDLKGGYRSGFSSLSENCEI